MNSALDRTISAANELASAGKDQEALSVANSLTQQHPAEMRVWALRAYVYALLKDYDAAIADLSNAIAIAPMEPSLFFNRGRYEFVLDHFQAAVDDFTSGLELCDYHDNEYYRETLLFMRAEALTRLGKKKEALLDLQQVRDDFTLWTSQLRTKADLVAECLR